MGLFGSKKTTVPATGYYSLPAAYRQPFDDINTQLPGATTPANFTLPDFNGDQINAFDLVRQMANPTASGISSLVSAYQNPYDDSVVNDINREATGQNSLVTQAGIQAGQQGSNRNFLATSDVEQNRLNNINRFKQSQYQNSLDTALNQQRAGIAGLLDVGSLQQEQDYQNQLAPFNALQARASILNPMVEFVGGSTPARTVKSGGFGIGDLASLARTGASLYTTFSDRNLKENIEPYGEESGHKTYKFSYKDDPQSKRYIGVMADEVEKIDPHAVIVLSNGHKAVHYGQIGVNFREAKNA